MSAALTRADVSRALLELGLLRGAPPLPEAQIDAFERVLLRAKVTPAELREAVDSILERETRWVPPAELIEHVNRERTERARLASVYRRKPAVRNVPSARSVLELWTLAKQGHDVRGFLDAR